MQRIENEILIQLQQEINKYDAEEGDYQWVEAFSFREEKDSVLVRVLCQTSDNELIDGMDIVFTRQDGKILIDPLYFESYIELIGSEKPTAYKWLTEFGPISFSQLGLDKDGGV